MNIVMYKRLLKKNISQGWPWRTCINACFTNIILQYQLLRFSRFLHVPDHVLQTRDYYQDLADSLDLLKCQDESSLLMDYPGYSTVRKNSPELFRRHRRSNASRIRRIPLEKLRLWLWDFYDYKRCLFEDNDVDDDASKRAVARSNFRAIVKA